MPRNSPEFSEQAEALSRRLLEQCEAAKLTLAVAESCSGGLLAQVITALPGASVVFAGGIVSYSNAAKMRLLGVPQEVLQTKGAVSAETAEAMARGIFKAFPDVSMALSITGVAGPGASDSKPAGLVYIGAGKNTDKATGQNAAISAQAHNFTGDRDAVRRQSVIKALRFLVQLSEQTQ